MLAGSADAVPEMRPVIMIDIEGGTLSLRNLYPDVDVVRVQTWKEMQRVYDALYSGQHDYRTVILDSLTEIQKFGMYNIMQFVVREDPDRDPDIPSIREWGKSIEQMRKLVRAFRDLPMHTIFTALVKYEKNKKSGITTGYPYLSGKLAGEVAGFVDVVGYLNTKLVDGEVTRLLQFQGTETTIAKDRTGTLPPVVEEPTMGILLDYVLNANIEEKEE